MRNAGLDEAQAGIKTAGGNINNLRYANDTTLITESEEELKSLFMKVKENEKVGLKLNIKKMKIWSHHFMANRWETMETVADFIFGGSKITAMVTAAMKLKGTCSSERKLWQTQTAY